MSVPVTPAPPPAAPTGPGPRPGTGSGPGAGSGEDFSRIVERHLSDARRDNRSAGDHAAEARGRAADRTADRAAEARGRAADRSADRAAEARDRVIDAADRAADRAERADQAQRHAGDAGRGRAAGAPARHDRAFERAAECRTGATTDPGSAGTTGAQATGAGADATPGDAAANATHPTDAQHALAAAGDATGVAVAAAGRAGATVAAAGSASGATTLSGLMASPLTRPAHLGMSSAAGVPAGAVAGVPGASGAAGAAGATAAAGSAAGAAGGAGSTTATAATQQADAAAGKSAQSMPGPGSPTAADATGVASAGLPGAVGAGAQVAENGHATAAKPAAGDTPAEQSAVGPQAGAPVAAPAHVSGTGSTTATNAPAGPTGSPVLDQVLPVVPRLVSRGDGTHQLTLKLHPADLGEIHLTVRVRGDQVDVTLAAGASARDALREGSAQLRSLLDLTGHTTGAVVVRDLPAPGAGAAPTPVGTGGQPAFGQAGGEPGGQQRPAGHSDARSPHSSGTSAGDRGLAEPARTTTPSRSDGRSALDVRI